MNAPELNAEFVDLEQTALAEADRHFGDIHGTPDQWSEPEWATYEHLLNRIRGMFHADPAVA